MLTIQSVLDPEELAEVRRLIDAGNWVDGRGTAGPLSAAVKRNSQLDERDAAGHAAGAIILAALARCGVFASFALPGRIVPPLFNRYAAGQGYGDHIDSAIRPIGDGRMRLDLSATLFLSAPGDYAGGELVIMTDGAEQAVKLAAGDMVVYSAGTVHRVNAVTRGRRDASFFWVQSLVRDSDKRAMLFGLDRDIQALGNDPGAMAVVISLVALYNNLLRTWSEV
ncbi:MAG: Fe2+-dependent dioxygenase [Sphingomonas sp.]